MQILEIKHRVELPQDYRDFVLNVGNGGNQPGTGMLTVNQSLSLLRGQSTDSNNTIDYRDLTKYYRALNLFDCNDLLECYYETFGVCNMNNDIEYKSYHMVLDDYFTEDGVFKYQHVFSEDERLFFEYESQMKFHLLVFSFDNLTRTQYAIAMDGAHKEQVLYYSYEPIAKHLSGRNIVFTNMTFLEWMYNLYNCSCNPYNINLKM